MEEEDPLGIGPAKETESITIPTSPVVIIKSESGPVDLLGDDPKPKKKRRLRSIKSSEIFFDPTKIETEEPKMIVSTDDRVIGRKQSILDADLGKDENEQFKVFIDQESLETISRVPSRKTIQTRQTLLDLNIHRLGEILDKMQAKLDQCVLLRSEKMKESEDLVNTFISLRRKGIHVLRKEAAIHSILIRKESRLYSAKSEFLRAQIYRTMLFRDYLRSFKGVKTCPLFLMDSYIKSTKFNEEQVQNLKHKIKVLRSLKVTLQPIQSIPNDWVFNICNPMTKYGRIIQRYEDRMDSLFYPDVITIAEKLSEMHPYDEVEQLLFDIAWSKKSYPFGINRKSSVPNTLALFPAAVANTLLTPEEAATPFSYLQYTNCPFNKCLNYLFEMLLQTSPFVSAKIFWDLIQEVAAIMKNIMVVRQGIDAEDVEIDFDSLFPQLIVCVLAFGIDEWIQCALWTMSFAEMVADEPQLQFAMTYLEGLVTQILALDVTKLRKKAEDLRTQWADEISDPLASH